MNTESATRPPLRIAILDDYQGVALHCADWAPLKSLQITVFQDTLQDEVDLAKRLAPFTIVCAMRERTKFPASLLAKLPNLRLIATTGLVNRGIDVTAAAVQGIVVSGTEGSGNSTLEHIWALILGTARHIAHEHTSVQAADPQWQHFIPLGLHGKTLGLVGLGRLGTSTAQIAKAFNMNVVAWSPHLTKERAEAAGVRCMESKEALLESSDIVSIHMVLSPETTHMITSSDFSRMKSSALFINTSRGPLTDENALIHALQINEIAGAGLDVFDQEPLPLNHPFRSLSNVTISPHLGYVADDNYRVFWQQTVENIQAFLDGHPKRVIH